MKKLLGRKEVEEAVSQLDMLTKEESLMVAVRNLEITQQVDDKVEATKALVKDNAKGIEEVARRVDNGTKHYLSIFMHILTPFPLCPIIVTHELKRLSRPDTLLLILEDDTRSQGTRCRRSSDHGYLHQIHPSITILHAKFNTAGRQPGLSKATRSKIGREMGH